ncbi:MAG: flagellar export chaperone FliS [Spirochaetia bacterium]|nr:flagellar export chaperone FliS [Spirochaetia bacterium]
MNPYSKDLINQYKKTQVSTADRGQLVVMLYEGAIRFINTAIDKMHFSTYDLVNTNLQKTMEIINELRASLDHKAGGELASRLESIYVFMNNRIQEANIQKSVPILKEVRGLLEELLAAWKAIAQKSQGGDEAKGGGISVVG